MDIFNEESIATARQASKRYFATHSTEKYICTKQEGIQSSRLLRWEVLCNTFNSRFSGMKTPAAGPLSQATQPWALKGWRPCFTQRLRGHILFNLLRLALLRLATQRWETQKTRTCHYCPRALHAPRRECRRITEPAAQGHSCKNPETKVRPGAAAYWVGKKRGYPSCVEWPNARSDRF